MKPEPLKGKEWDVTISGYKGTKYHKGFLKENVKLAVEWLLLKRCFKNSKGKAFNYEGDEMYVFKKEDFEEAFEDVI